LYPEKEIVSLATNTHVEEFRSGDEANEYVKDRGFKVVELRPEFDKPSWIFQSNPKYYDVMGGDPECEKN
jgi:hypothetical protein